MAAGVTLPLWLVILAGVLALIGLLDRLLVPSVRWFIRSRANKVLDEVGSRLRIEIRPFQHTRRQALIDRLLYDDKVQQAAAACMRAQNMPRELVMARIQGYAREIVPAFNAYFYFRVGYWLGRKIARSLYRVRVGYTDNEGLARGGPCERPEPDFHRRALPPRDRRERFAHRLRRRPRAQTLAARARKQG